MLLFTVLTVLLVGSAIEQRLRSDFHHPADEVRKPNLSIAYGGQNNDRWRGPKGLTRVNIDCEDCVRD